MPQLQRKPHWCGPASIQAALEVLDIYTTQAAIAKRIDCGWDYGSDEQEIMRGIMSFGVGCTPHTFYGVDHLEGLGPLIICVDNYEHWCCWLGQVVNKNIVFDPANTKEGRKRNGMRYYTDDALKTRWRSDEGIFYGIELWRK